MSCSDGYKAHFFFFFFFFDGSSYSFFFFFSLVFFSRSFNPRLFFSALRFIFLRIVSSSREPTLSSLVLSHLQNCERIYVPLRAGFSRPSSQTLENLKATHSTFSFPSFLFPGTDRFPLLFGHFPPIGKHFSPPLPYQNPLWKYLQ